MSGGRRFVLSISATADGTVDKPKARPRSVGKSSRLLESGPAACFPVSPIDDVVLGDYLHILRRDTAVPVLGPHLTDTHRSARVPWTACFPRLQSLR